MKQMKKIEIVLESVYTNRLLELFRKNGITAYTIIKDVEGNGEHGLRQADEVTDVFSNDYIFTVCEEEVLNNIKEQIRTFSKKYSGKCIVTDVMWLL